MIKIQDVISTVRFSKSWRSITNLKPTEFKEIVQIKSSLQSTVSSLNEAEISNLKERGDWHGNRKYPYPYWKICNQCEMIFPAMDKSQSKQNKTCSEKCAKSLISKNRSGRPKMKNRDYTTEVTCKNCGEVFWKRQDRTGGKNFCTKECHTEWRSESEKVAKHMRKIAATGIEGWDKKQLEKLSEQMTGKTNPSWKGGVTYKSGKGNYDDTVLVKCPKEYEEMARKNGYVLEHRLKVAKEIGRPLKSEEVVHHIDHDPQNNEMENLMLFRNNREHKLYEHNGSPKPIWQPSNQ